MGTGGRRDKTETLGRIAFNGSALYAALLRDDGPKGSLLR